MSQTDWHWDGEKRAVHFNAQSEMRAAQRGCRQNEASSASSTGATVPTTTLLSLSRSRFFPLSLYLRTTPYKSLSCFFLIPSYL